MPIPTFETDRLILKEVTLEDLPAYNKHFVNYEVIRHLSSHVPWPYPDDGVESFLTAMVFPDMGTSQWLWGIFLKTNPNELIGAVHLIRQGKPENRGFWLGQDHWGHGYMTEAVVPVNRYAFEELGFEKLVFANAVQNKRSSRIKEKTGARFIENRPAKFVDPQYTQHEIWELTKEEWTKFN